MAAEQDYRGAEKSVPEDDAVMIEDVSPVSPATGPDPAANPATDPAGGPGKDAAADPADTPAPAIHGTGTEHHLERDSDRSWQQIQASFIDDPHASVAEAAALVEKTAEMFVATIQERERSLRGAWEHNGADSDTESLRTTLRDYRALYEQISQS